MYTDEAAKGWKGLPKLTKLNRREAWLPASRRTHPARESPQHWWAWIATHTVLHSPLWGWGEEKQTNPGEAVPFVLELSGATSLSWAVLSSRGLSCCFPGAVSRFFHCCFRPVDTCTVHSSQEAEASFLLTQGLLLLQGQAARSQPQACHTMALRVS